MTVIHPSSLVLQTPKTAEHYSLEPAVLWGRWWAEAPTVRTVQPARLDASTLTARVSSLEGKRTLLISGGVAGATYEISLSGQSFRLRVTHDGDEQASVGVETPKRRLRLSRDERTQGLRKVVS